MMELNDIHTKYILNYDNKIDNISNDVLSNVSISI